MDKNVKSIRNPFVIAEYAGPEYFCDRTEETQELVSNLQNGRNTTLISPRRIGKSGLIQHAFHRLKNEEPDAVCIYIDIFTTKNLHEFVQLLGTAIVQHVLSCEQQALKRVLQFFGSWRPVFSTAPYTGMPTVSVSIEPSQSEHTLKTIFDYLRQSERNIYIAINEFQQITSYPETGTEALLRSYVQFVPNVHFIFSGSRMHLMTQIFNSPSRPFFQSTTGLGLYPLHEEVYYDFSRRFFEAVGGCLTEDAFHTIYSRFDGITYNVQQVLNCLYDMKRHVKGEQQVNEVVGHILYKKRMEYETLVQFLTDNQLSLLKAIARVGCVKSPQGSDFILQNNLPGASSVKVALQVLTDKDLVYRETEGYIVYDRFFALWLRNMQQPIIY
ncbi:MAG: ATP-binding protein [Prevotella sp.]|nr:ATP-binding protein [Prevotella sp.]